jgi:hypothetical protein
MSWATGDGFGFAMGVGLACTRERRSDDAARAVLKVVENMVDGGGRVSLLDGLSVVK